MCCAFIKVLIHSNSQLEQKGNSKRTMRLHDSAVQVTVWGVREYAIFGEACEA